LSQLLGTKKVKQDSYWLVPDYMHHPIKQDVVLLRSAEKSQGAKAFLDFIHSNKAQKIIAEYGYLVTLSSHAGQGI
jgi:molybdate transport system substrate-binding protein